MEKEFDGTSYGKIVYRQSKNPTMDKKICIVVCPTGALFAKAQNPTQPYTPEEIAREVIDAYREGACMAHLHNRDEKGYNLSTEEVITETMDLIFDECPDIITSPSVHMGFEPEKGSYSLESVKPMIEALLKHGRKYIQTTIFTPISYILDGFLCVATEENTQATIKYLQSVGVKPEFMGHNFEAIENVKEWVIKPRLLKKPYFISMGPGMHNAAATYPDPWGLLYLINMKHMMPEDAVIGTSIGGRNWLPLTVEALMLGVDFIRVGKEDTMWMYPHRDDILERNADAVKKIVTIARELGREIATPDEAREILGIKL